MGLAWNYWRNLELRTSAYAFSNINRGLSLTKPFGFKDGVKIETRYLFDSARGFDVTKGNFIGLGYLPTKELVGGDGVGFRPSAFAHSYLTQDIPASWFNGYVYSDLQIYAERPISPRLLDADTGVAIRPFGNRPGVEFRLGLDRNDDVKLGKSTDVFYASARYIFGTSGNSKGGTGATTQSDVWGLLGLPIYGTGSRAAPNGQIYKPLFTLKSEFNLGLLSDQRLYLFWDSDFWTQRATPGVTNASQGQFDFSKREFNNKFGAAINAIPGLEGRVSVYALDNLNRGTNLDAATGEAWGIAIEGRHYFENSDIYDVARRGFIAIGWEPTGDLIGPSGDIFNAGPYLRGYETFDLPISMFPLYGYTDLSVVGKKNGQVKIIDGDFGLAARPFLRKSNLEVRSGFTISHEIVTHKNQDTAYAAFRVLY